MAPANPGLDLRKARVMVLDDNPKAADVLCATLRGFRVQEIEQCESVATAKLLTLRKPFDLILADCEMPVEDGVEFTRWLRSGADGPNFTAPVILLSAYASWSRALAARDAGASMIVARPVAPGVLLSRVEWVARNNRKFISCDSYSGPDRRFKVGNPPEGVEERRQDALALASQTDRALSQTEIDSLFG